MVIQVSDVIRPKSHFSAKVGNHRHINKATPAAQENRHCKT